LRVWRVTYNVLKTTAIEYAQSKIDFVESTSLSRTRRECNLHAWECPTEHDYVVLKRGKKDQYVCGTGMNLCEHARRDAVEILKDYPTFVVVP
jgi:hypothetical protein